MQPIRTLEDLIHAVTNSLGLISSHSQYVLDQPAAMGTRTEDLEIICDEAQRAAKLLRLVPRGLAKTPIQETTDASTLRRSRRESAQPATRHDKGQ
jgi:hypothetical protein